MVIGVRKKVNIYLEIAANEAKRRTEMGVMEGEASKSPQIGQKWHKNNEMGFLDDKKGVGMRQMRQIELKAV